MKQRKHLKRRHDRPSVSLSKSTGSYGTGQSTVTQNSGAILTSYMMQSITIKKLAEEVRPQEMQMTAKEKKNKEATDLLSGIFDEFTREHAPSAFSFINESIISDSPSDTGSASSLTMSTLLDVSGVDEPLEPLPLRYTPNSR